MRGRDTEAQRVAIVFDCCTIHRCVNLTLPLTLSCRVLMDVISGNTHHPKITKSDQKIPLSVYNARDGTPCNITSAAVETCMRSAASKMFNLDPVKNRTELQMWSTHSLRVGACTTLYAMGFHEMEIKHLLRWKSNAFMTYLRNLAVTSRRHNDALADASCIPNFL